MKSQKKSDVTEREKMESALRESEARFRRLADNAPDIIYRYEAEGDKARLTFISPSVEKITGYPPEAFYADPELGFKIIHPSDHDVSEALQGRASIFWRMPVEFRVIRKDKKIIWLELHAVPVTDPKGEITAVEGIARDVTEKKINEKLLRESERRMRTMLEHVRLMAVMIDARGRLFFCNSFFTEITGWSPLEVLGQDYCDIFVPEESREKTRGLIRRLLAGKSLNTYGVHEIVARNGDRRIVGWNTTVLLGSRLEVTGIAVIGEDVTDRLKAERALRESEKKYRNLAELLPQGLFEADLSGRITYVNVSALDLFGYTRQDIAEGVNIVQTVVPEDKARILKSVAAIAAGRKLVPGEYTGIRKDGTTFPVLIFAGAVLQGNRPAGIRGIAIDFAFQRKGC